MVWAEFDEDFVICIEKKGYRLSVSIGLDYFLDIFRTFFFVKSRQFYILELYRLITIKIP